MSIFKMALCYRCVCVCVCVYYTLCVCVVCVKHQEELRILSSHLEAEKKKTETLLYAMLPRHVANQLKEGKKVEAGTFVLHVVTSSTNRML